MLSADRFKFAHRLPLDATGTDNVGPTYGMGEADGAGAGAVPEGEFAGLDPAQEFERSLPRYQ